jgi:two-component system CheB/CheR fusion protein
MPSPSRPVSFAEITQRMLLSEYAPAAVLINRKNEILYSHGPADRYLAVPAGEPTQDLMLLARDGLRIKLRSAIHQAVRENGPLTLPDAKVKRNGDYHSVIVTIRPVQGPQGADGLLLVTFQESDQGLPPPRPPESQVEEPVVRQLENELNTVKHDLQSMIEELELSNEELKVSNEEVMSMNEELLSATKELKTSKEELRSLKEELSTVNNQLRDKSADLETAKNDMANVLDCTDVAFLFLDDQLRIKRFTPAATRLFNLISSDLNRPIGDITPKFTDGTLQSDVAEVLRTLASHQTQVPIPTSDGCFWNRRISPYRTLDNRIEGVVVTFTDVTQIRRAAEEAQQFAAVFMDLNDAVCVHDFDGKISAWNRGAQQMFGYGETEALQMNEVQMIPEELHPQMRAHWERLRQGERVDTWEAQRITKYGRILDVSVAATALKDAMGRPVAIAKTERDITEHKRAHARLEDEVQKRTAALRKSQEELAAVLHTAADAIITIDATGSIQSVNQATERMFGYTTAELVGRNVKMLMPSPYREEHDRYLESYRKTGVKKIIGIGRETAAKRKDGSVFPVDLSVSEVDHLGLFTGILRDITRRKELEREVVEIASLEQRRIGQDLHDSVGQELTALNLLAGDLSDVLQTNPASASKLTERIVQGLQRSQRELRTVMQGLLPVPVDTEGLMSALSDLADHTMGDGKTNCTFQCPEVVAVADNLTATHLYLIAKEAVHNAVKHARPRNIYITLESNDLLKLSVLDDGIGMPIQPTESHGGLGLRIMRNRAAIIGATLTIQPVEPTGTLISCSLLRKNHETKPDQETS